MIIHMKTYVIWETFSPKILSGICECRTHNSSVVLETDFIGAINNTEATSVYIDMGNSIAISYWTPLIM